MILLITKALAKWLSFVFHWHQNNCRVIFRTYIVAIKSKWSFSCTGTMSASLSYCDLEGESQSFPSASRLLELQNPPEPDSLSLLPVSTVCLLEVRVYTTGGSVAVAWPAWRETSKVLSLCKWAMVSISDERDGRGRKCETTAFQEDGAIWDIILVKEPWDSFIGRWLTRHSKSNEFLPLQLGCTAPNECWSRASFLFHPRHCLHGRLPSDLPRLAHLQVYAANPTV